MKIYTLIKYFLFIYHYGCITLILLLLILKKKKIKKLKIVF